MSRKKFCRKPDNKSFMCFFSENGWILTSFFFCVFMDLDSFSVHKLAKNNLANNQPSLPHVRSTTYIYFTLSCITQHQYKSFYANVTIVQNNSKCGKGTQHKRLRLFCPFSKPVSNPRESWLQFKYFSRMINCYIPIQT